MSDPGPHAGSHANPGAFFFFSSFQRLWFYSLHHHTWDQWLIQQLISGRHPVNDGLSEMLGGISSRGITQKDTRWRWQAGPHIRARRSLSALKNNPRTMKVC